MKGNFFFNVLPVSCNIGGQEVEVRQQERLEKNLLGQSYVTGSYIAIANTVNFDDKPTPTSKTNTFFHELTHAILDTMGYYDLSGDEKFVCAFAGFMTEAMRSAEYNEEEFSVVLDKTEKR